MPGSCSRSAICFDYATKGGVPGKGALSGKGELSGKGQFSGKGQHQRSCGGRDHNYRSWYR